eukprot:scaffold5310_cov378-Prasinococcus_capsulatus_cf.AAC.7
MDGRPGGTVSAARRRRRAAQPPADKAEGWSAVHLAGSLRRRAPCPGRVQRQAPRAFVAHVRGSR